MTLAVRQALRYALQSAMAVLGVTIGVANIIVLISITDLGRRQATGLIATSARICFSSPPLRHRERAAGQLQLTPSPRTIFPAPACWPSAAAPEIESRRGHPVYSRARGARFRHAFFTTVQGSSTGLYRDRVASTRSAAAG